MSDTEWVIVAIVVIVGLVAFRFRKNIALRLKGLGFDLKIHAEDKDKPPPGNGGKVEASGTRSVAIGRDANSATITTGDDNKIR